MTGKDSHLRRLFAHLQANKADADRSIIDLSVSEGQHFTLALRFPAKAVHRKAVAQTRITNLETFPVHTPEARARRTLLSTVGRSLFSKKNTIDDATWTSPLALKNSRSVYLT